MIVLLVIFHFLFIYIKFCSSVHNVCITGPCNPMQGPSSRKCMDGWMDHTKHNIYYDHSQSLIVLKCECVEEMVKMVRKRELADSLYSACYCHLLLLRSVLY